MLNVLANIDPPVIVYCTTGNRRSPSSMVISLNFFLHLSIRACTVLFMILNSFCTLVASAYALVARSWCLRTSSILSASVESTPTARLPSSPIESSIFIIVCGSALFRLSAKASTAPLASLFSRSVNSFTFIPAILANFSVSVCILVSMLPKAVAAISSRSRFSSMTVPKPMICA